MSITQKILLGVLVVFVSMQFIRPARNISSTIQTADMAKRYYAPAVVQGVLQTACYDCHSNNTHYPWYANVQPIGWLLAMHVRDGKEDLNFNEFTTYSNRRQLSKLKSIKNSIKDGSMPLRTYIFLHNDAKLSKDSKAAVIGWTEKLIDSLTRAGKSSK